jgi:fucose 4-O-acetylase-like acetyltransferase
MSTSWQPRGLLAMAAATPPERDRYIDFLRGFSILVVVLGHWLIAVVEWQGGRVEGSNALEHIRGLWALTWLLQVMPLFFFVGGFGNGTAWRASQRRGEGYAAYLARRVERMLRPTAVFLGAGLAVVVTLDAANVADNVVFPASELITRPLWFLGVYLIVVALAPVMLSVHNRLGLLVPVAMVALAALVDWLRFGADLPGVGYVNYPVVWLLAHQLGFHYGSSGVLHRNRWWLAAAGLGGMIVATTFGPYPGSMVGLSTDEFSNMDPPTLAIVALTVWQVGLAMILRAPIARWLGRLNVWAAVIFINSVIMTVFLWHLTAMLFGVGILFPLGFPQPEVGTLQWWLLRPVWVAVLTVILAALVLVFGRAEQRTPARTPHRPAARGSVAMAATGVALVVLGILGFAMGGLHQLFSLTGVEVVVFRSNPALDVIHLSLGAWLVVAATAARRVVTRAAAIGAIGLAALAVLGPILTAHPEINRLALNSADTVLHAVGSVTLAAVAAVGRREVPD